MGKILKESIADVKIERKDGTKIVYMKLCPELEQTFRDACGAETERFRNENFSGNRYPIMELSPQFRKWAARYQLNKPDGPLDFNQTFNFSWVFMEGISKGKELKFSGLYSEEFLTDYAQALEHFIQEIYNEFVSPISIEAKLSLRTVRV